MRKLVLHSPCPRWREPGEIAIDCPSPISPISGAYQPIAEARDTIVKVASQRAHHTQGLPLVIAVASDIAQALILRAPIG